MYNNYCLLHSYTISHSKRPFSKGKWAVMSENGPVTLRISNAQRCKKTYKPEPFFILSLPLPLINEPSLIDCFNLFTETESIDGYENEKTKKRETIQKRITFWSLPQILVIDLKRFNARNQKKQNLVSFPLTNLDLSPYVSGYNPSKYKYDLYGVCNHSGGALGGHYTAYVKPVTGGKWYHFNDTSVSEVDERVVVSTKAYCLFYRMR